MRVNNLFAKIAKANGSMRGSNESLSFRTSVLEISSKGSPFK
jgi:hypothetical protein